MTRVVVVTPIPSPYQVELFDALYAAGTELCVVYAAESDPDRAWAARDIAHLHKFLQRGFKMCEQIVASADLCVFSMYRHGAVRAWIDARHRRGEPWCFWGERPGATQRGLAGRLFRRLHLRQLFRSTVPIWGIGQFAIDGYAREFGNQRLFINLPYFSDLARFRRTQEQEHSHMTRVLFSGSLTPRKGVDLLASAFLGAALESEDVCLDVVGTGPLESRMREILAPVMERVRFHGFRDWQDLPSAYGLGDVLVVPSRYDGWGLVVAEGLGAGLPVVATNQTGAALDLITDNQNGWIVEAGSGDDLSRCLQLVVDAGEGRLADMRRHAINSVASHQLQDGVTRFGDAVTATLREF